MDCRVVEESYGAYLLGALEPKERAEVAAHLEQCPSCSLELRLDSRVLTHLATSVTQVAAPASVKERLMARVGTAGPQRAKGDAVTWLRRALAALTTPSWGMAGAYAGAAAVVVAVVGMVWLSGRVNDVATENEALAQRIESDAQESQVALAGVEERLDEVAASQETMDTKAEETARLGTRLDALIAEQSALATQVQTVAARGSDLMDMVKETRYLAYMAAEPGTNVNMLWSEQRTVQARGMMMVSPDRTWGILAVLDLPPLPQGQVYQVWLIKGNTVFDAGTFVVNPFTSQGQVRIQFPVPPDELDAIGITIEPAGGSPGPTSDSVLAGEF